MFKKILIYFLSFLSIFLAVISLNTNIVQSADENALDNGGKKCLTAVNWTHTDGTIICGHCEPEASTGEIDWPKCIDSGAAHSCVAPFPPVDDDGNILPVNFTLQGTDFPANTPIYPVVCFDNETCTTGSSTNDIKRFGSDLTQRFSITYQSNSEGVFLSDDSGNVSIQGILIGVAKDGQYPFYGIYYANELGSGAVNQNVTGQAASQQQGTLTFSQLFSGDNTKQNCAVIYFDPYGRVFDSQSLEPMEGVTVRMLSKISPTELMSFVPSGNPVTTLADGVFNFLAQPGSYYLRLFNVPSTHSFINDPILNPKYSLIYKKNADMSDSLYKPDEVINELIDTPEERAKGAPDLEERDIALDPGTNPPYRFPIKHLSLTQNINGDDVTYSGKASHPYPVLTIKDEFGNIYLNKKEFTDDRARYGYWQISGKYKDVPVNTALIPILSKNPKYFQTDSSDVTVIDGNSPRFEPILKHVQGMAKDDQNQLLINSTISVILNMNNKVYAKTQSDSSGFFQFNSAKLPPFSYHLEYSSKDVSSPIKKATSSFVKDNEAYLKDHKINLMVRNGQSTNNSSFASKNQFKNNNFDNNNEAQSSANNFDKKYLYVVLIIILLTITVSLSIYFFIKKNRI